MDKLVIHARKGLLHGRTYLWYGEDLLVIEGNLCKEGQRAAIEEALADLRRRRSGAALAGVAA